MKLEITWNIPLLCCICCIVWFSSFVWGTNVCRRDMILFKHRVHVGIRPSSGPVMLLYELVLRVRNHPGGSQWDNILFWLRFSQTLFSVTHQTRLCIIILYWTRCSLRSYCNSCSLINNTENDEDCFASWLLTLMKLIIFRGNTGEVDFSRHFSTNIQQVG